MNVLSSEIDHQPAILSVATSTPAQRYSQEQIYDLACTHSEFYRSHRIREIFMNSDIAFRHLYLDANALASLETTDQMHKRYQIGAVEIGKKAIQKCIAESGLTADEIDYVIAVSCTGYLCPGLSSIYIKELGLRNNVQRADLIGMGCAGAMPGLQRAYDFVKAYPEKKALVVAVEICSACYYLDDSLETVVGNAICGDGAAAVLVGLSAANTVPKIVGFESFLEPAYIDTVGFEQREGKLRIILSKDIRDLAGGLSCQLVDQILRRFNVGKDQVAHWILHSGGRKVIDGVRQAIGLTADQVHHSKYVLSNFGNMSSPTVLFVLNQALHHSNGTGVPRPDDLGIMLALGPGLAVEGALLKW
ncbi:MAG: type III polyketide synthase [Ignavibacteriales bacterium]|nr:type III polyketide synthase [Ignavibacteriales bacterium]